MSKFKVYDKVTFNGKQGTVMGYVGYEMPLTIVRVSSPDDKNKTEDIRDIHETKLTLSVS